MTSIVAASTRDEDAAGDLSRRAALALDGITKQWGAATVLDDVTLELHQGERVWLEGANGVGKTTLLRIAAGIISPDRGSVLLDGLDPEHDRREFHRRVGFLSAGDRALYPRLSARGHLNFAVRLALIPPAEQEAAVAHALDAFALEGFADRRADRLSTGQRQRLRVALALIHQPTVVILDEPANSLDRDGLDVIDAYLLRLRRRGGAAIWAAPSGTRPDLDFDCHYRLERGKLIAS